jgi:hypothetical protein
MVTHDGWKWTRQALLLVALVAVPACDGYGSEESEESEESPCVGGDCEPPEYEEAHAGDDTSQLGCFPPDCKGGPPDSPPPDCDPFNWNCVPP